MRVRWQVAAGTSAAVLAGAGTIVAVSSQGSGRSAHHRPPVVTVSSLGVRAVDGVIATGTINGKAWRIKLVGKEPASTMCWAQPGSGFAQNANCLKDVARVVRHWGWHKFHGPADLWSFSPAIFGPVQPAVTRVAMRLSDGVVLILRPVEAFGHRWIGVVLPVGLVPVKAVAYARDGELAHSVPFNSDLGGPSSDFMSWLPAGDNGPRRMTKVVSGAGVKLTLYTGPWGNVLIGGGAGYSFPLSSHLTGALSGSYGLPRVVPMAFPWPARYMTLDMSDGTKRHVRLVQGAGLAFAIVKAPRNPRISTWSVYDGRGHRLSGGNGAPG